MCILASYARDCNAFIDDYHYTHASHTNPYRLHMQYAHYAPVSMRKCECVVCLIAPIHTAKPSLDIYQNKNSIHSNEIVMPHTFIGRLNRSSRK